MVFQNRVYKSHYNPFFRIMSTFCLFALSEEHKVLAGTYKLKAGFYELFDFINVFRCG